MSRTLRHKFILIALAASVPVFAVAIDVARAPSPSGGEAAETAVEHDEGAVVCSAARASIDSELAELRTRCGAEVAAFEACRASRPEWTDVALFSCGFDMSTDLTRGDLDDTASLEDCGASGEPARADATRTCPVPACESELELLEEAAARKAC